MDLYVSKELTRFSATGGCRNPEGCPYGGEPPCGGFLAGYAPPRIRKEVGKRRFYGTPWGFVVEIEVRYHEKVGYYAVIVGIQETGKVSRMMEEAICNGTMKDYKNFFSKRKL